MVDAELLSNHKLIILKTEKSFYFKYIDRKDLLDNEDWIDYYYEKQTGSFYRKDSRGFWYDTEGIRLRSTVILKDNTLISLDSKSSKQNQIFKNIKPYTSPNNGLIQIGKVVLDNQLNTIVYYNERITGLGKDAIAFDNGIVYQQVLIGLKNFGFVNEKNKQPINISGHDINRYKGKIDVGLFTFYIFKSNENTYYINKENCEVLEIDSDNSCTIDENSYFRIGEDDIVKVHAKSDKYYYNLSRNEPFNVEELGSSKITRIEKSHVSIDNQELFNISSSSKSIVIKSDLVQYEIEKPVEIEKIKNVPGFQSIFAFVTIKGKQQLYSLQSHNLILLENDAIVAVDGHDRNKLLNAISANGQRIVLDLRKGYKNLLIAKSDDRIITQTESEPYKLGSKILQNVKIQTLGGVQERVIDLNSETLSIFGLPSQLMTYTDGDEKSVFADSALISVDPNNVIKIEDRKFVSALFRSFDDELHSIILDAESGRPFRIDGLGHKLEIVTSFKTNSNNESYKIGPHTMIGVRTLKEDLKTNELLFSTKIMSSMIPFSDSYLPVLKQIVEVNGTGSWEYNLFELHTLSNEKEFIAVEKNFPYRILVKSKDDKQEPIVVTSKEKVIKSPKEISIISKLFYTQSQILAEVY